MKNIYLYLVIFILFIISFFVTYFGHNTADYSKTVSVRSDKESAIAKAKEVYSVLKNKGADFSKGPCIAEDLMPDWVADIAHNPRTNVDNLTENQCQSFREGKSHHFVELDPEGNFIRAE